MIMNDLYIINLHNLYILINIIHFIIYIFLILINIFFRLLRTNNYCWNYLFSSK